MSRASVQHAPPSRSATSHAPTSPSAIGRVWTELVDAGHNPLVRRGMLAMLLIAAGSMTPAFLPPDAPIVDTLRLGWLQEGVGRFAATVVLSVGIILLLDTWLRLRPVAGARTAPAATWALWAIPVLWCPPLFSRDAYSYAAQGLVVARGMDPYQTGPIAVPGAYANQVDPLWLYTAAPYGPAALQVQHFIVSLTGDNAYLAAVMMRLPALASMAVIAYALPRLAERVGVSRQQAVWLGVLNPLVIMHIVGGSHNDAMMIALTVASLLLATYGHLALGCVTLALAAGFKQTAVMAIIGVVALAVRHRRGEVPPRPYLWGLVKGSVIWLAAFQVMTMATGLGWGWVPNLAVPASIRSLLSPPTLVGSIAEGVMYVLGAPRAWQLVPVALMQSIGLLCFLAFAGWLTFRLAPRRPVYASALAFIGFCLGGPVIHPWYMLWGGVLLGAVRLGRRAFRAAVYVSLFLCLYSMMDAAFANASPAIIVSGLALLAWSLQGLLRPGAPPPGDGRAGGLLGPQPWAVGPAPQSAIHEQDPDKQVEGQTTATVGRPARTSLEESTPPE